MGMATEAFKKHAACSHSQPLATAANASRKMIATRSSTILSTILLIANHMVRKWFQEGSVPEHVAFCLPTTAAIAHSELSGPATRDLLRGGICPAAIRPQGATAMPSAAAEYPPPP